MDIVWLARTLRWRGQKAWEKEFGRLQYQAFRKVTGVVQGTGLAGVEDMHTHLDNNQVRSVEHCVEDPSKLGEL